MRYRTLGRTGLSVSEVGYGAWGIGGQWPGTDERESRRALRRAIERGVNFIDTALLYQDSERIVGQVVNEHPGERIYVATKIPVRVWPAPPGADATVLYPGRHIRRSVEKSLTRLGVEALDVVQLHVWSDRWVGQGDWLEALEKLKSDGKIRFTGVSINPYEPDNVLRLIRTGRIDVIQAIYNIFHQAPRERLLPACQEHGIGVIVRVPLDEGGLTGNVTAESVFPEGDFRRDYFRGERAAQVEERVNALVRDLEIDVRDLPEIALRFALSEQAVSTVIPGMRTVRNVERNTAIGGPLPDGQLGTIAGHRWERNFLLPTYQAPH